MIGRRAHAPLLVALVAAVAALLYLPGLGRVHAPVWDEAFYIPATARYHEGRTQFASHPPLGLMLIAAGDMASGRNAGADWRTIGAGDTIAAEAMPAGFDYSGPRLAPALFAVLAAALFALVLLALTGSPLAAGIASLLVLADTAIIVQSRAALLDPFQLAFALGAVLAAIRLVRGGGARWAFMLGAGIAAATLVRANGLTLAALMPFALWPALAARDWIGLARRIGAGLAGGLLTGALTLAAFIAMTPLPPDPATPIGRADAAFLAPAHAAALARGQWNPAAVWGAAQGIRAQMDADLAITPKSDANGSHPWGWLIGKGMILYRSDRTGTVTGAGPMAIGLMPNLVIWLVSLFGVASSLRSSRLRADRVRVMLLAGWAASFGALVYLDGLRVLYLYHYFVPLLFGHCMAVLEWRRAGLPLRPALALAVLALGALALGWRFATGTGLPAF